MNPVSLAWVFAALGLVSSPARAESAGPVVPARGINLGNALDAPSEGAWGMRILPGDLSRIAAAGFDSIRLPVRWSAHAEDGPPYAIDPAILERVDGLIDEALEEGLSVVLDFHHYEELFADPDGHRERFLGIWEQLADRYRDAPAAVLFELCNEPHGALDAPAWNRLLGETIGMLRRTHPTRTLVVGPAHYNAIPALSELKLPVEDRHLLVTVHYYEPMRFTHQGAGWVQQDTEEWLDTEWHGTAEERQAVESRFRKAKAWADARDRPMYLGEFGAYSKADLSSRARWTAFVRRTAEAHEMGWAYWEYAAGFGAFDRKTQSWRQPLLDALVDPDGSGPGD